MIFALIIWAFVILTVCSLLGLLGPVVDRRWKPARQRSDKEKAITLLVCYVLLPLLAIIWSNL
jgi:hypothetical protein